MKKVTTLLAVLAALALPAAASAQGVGYGSPGGSVQTTIDNGPDDSNTPKASSNSAPAATTQVKAPEENGNLPFTGLEVALVALAGLALVATGFGIRKAGSTRAAG